MILETLSAKVPITHLARSRNAREGTAASGGLRVLRDAFVGADTRGAAEFVSR